MSSVLLFANFEETISNLYSRQTDSEGFKSLCWFSCETKIPNSMQWICEACLTINSDTDEFLGRLAVRCHSCDCSMHCELNSDSSEEDVKWVLLQMCDIASRTKIINLN
jgi:hypothetical protein